ncbi:sigma-54 interaction domain-containing protein [Desulfobaculum sp. SPO524]|uniref:sigma-54 interaction domain-containing protein n=1 Tax=Desulfobaculum sp. SPO524 TaxID=3378071 RepID=UPI003852B497
MIETIEPSIRRIAEVISIVIGLDVEVVNSSFTRVAGTGRYAQGVGTSIIDAGQVYRTARRSGHPVYVEKPRFHPICNGCKKRDTCEEKLTLCAPIMVDGKVEGIIGIICFNEQDRARILETRDSFLTFIELMSNMVAGSIADTKRLQAMSQTVEMLQGVVDAYSDGVFVFGRDGEITYVNSHARRMMKLRQDVLPRAVDMTPTGNTVEDAEEYDLRCNGVELTVMARTVELVGDDARFAKLVIFESQRDYMRRMSRISSQPHGEGLGAILGESPVITKLKQRVQSIATSSSTVLITGESGTGKELFARAIHKESDRRDQPFIAINCGAIPDTLLESELFGYTSGAFTGARSSGRVGKFELANGGVLFLDEIGSMPLYLQVKLLRVLQERTVIRLGSNKLINIDIRVIAATNDNLQEQIANNTFRSDLFYRLNVIPFEIPPLRDRLEDVDMLTEHFFRKYGERFNKRLEHISPQCMEMLRSYPWPGNIREFENAIEFIVNMMPASGEVTPDCLPAFLHAIKTDAPRLEVADDIRPLDEVEREAIAKALERFGTSTSGKRLAAKRLGIGLATLYRKIQLYGL